jgi:hypothetical protein
MRLNTISVLKALGLELGVIARQRHPDKNVLPFPLMGAAIAVL